MNHRLHQDIEVEFYSYVMANLWLRYKRYLPRSEKKFHLWSIFPQKSLSYKNTLSRMKKSNLIPPVLLGTYNICLYLLVDLNCHFLVKVRLYHLLPTVLTLYFDGSGSFILSLTRVRKKDGKPKRILIYALKTRHPSGNAPPLALFEHIISEHI